MNRPLLSVAQGTKAAKKAVALSFQKEKQFSVLFSFAS
jgi:hypothetical protein